MYNWIKKHKTFIFIFFFSIFIFFSVIVVPILINEAYKKNEGYLTVWGGEDVLAYYGSIISAVGTIVLGIIAWKQNSRLLKIEENNFLASNGVSALLTEVTVTGIKQTATNFHLHDEQILIDCEVQQQILGYNYGSITFTCKLESFNELPHIAMVHVEEMNIFCFNDERQQKSAVVSVTNADTKNTYTTVAISKGFVRFNVLVILSGEAKKKVRNVLNYANCEILIDMTLSLLSDKFVATELKCRATLKNPNYDEEEGIYTHFKTEEQNPPMCFWFGTSLKHKQDIIIKQVKEDKKDGQAKNADHK